MKDREEAWSAIQKLALQSPHVELLSNPLSIQKPWNCPPSVVDHPSGDHSAGDRPPGDHSADGLSSGNRSTDAVDVVDDDARVEPRAEAKPLPKVLMKAYL